MHGLLTVALMSLMGSALTLPGIAGLVLGIAMAVDANVLIYERIREELRAGKSPIAAIDAGFTRAFVTIADSQLTTLACALVMFWLGAGPIRGFAVTLTIGICTSIFASVTVVRLLIYYWLNSMKQTTRGPLVAAGLGQGDNPCGSFPTSKASISSRTICGCPSCATRACAWRSPSWRWLCRWRSSCARGFNYGVDFKGGSMIEVQSKSGPADIAQLRDKLGRLGIGGVQIQSFGAPSDVLIRIEQQEGGEAEPSRRRSRRCWMRWATSTSSGASSRWARRCRASCAGRASSPWWRA